MSAKVIAITNQKGGVGKTTTALNLGVGLKNMGNRVLFIDMDSQCSLTYTMRAQEGGFRVLDVMMEKVPAAYAIQHLPEGDLIPSCYELSSAEMLFTQTGREFRLEQAIRPLREMYDYIIIDSPPALGILTVNVLTAASGVIIPALADVYSLHGVGQLYNTIQAIRQYCNPALKIYGILLTRHTERFILNREVREMLQETAEQIGTRVFRSTIREAVALRESEARQQSIFSYARLSKQAQDYLAFVNEFIQVEKGSAAR